MAYTALSTSTADVMKRSLEDLQKEINQVKSKDKKKAADLEKMYAQKLPTFLKKITDDIKIAKTGADAMMAKVESYHAQSTKYLATGKSALANYPKTRQKSDLMVLEGCPGTIKTCADLAAKEMDDFAVSWNAYRAWNPGDPKAAAEFNAIRNKIMEDTKIARGKVNRIESMVGEGEALKKAGAEASSMTLATAQEKEAQAKDLVKHLEGMTAPLAGGKETVEAVINNGRNFKSYTTLAVDKLKGMIRGLETQYSFTVKSVATFTSTVGSMQKTLATGKTTIQPEYLKDPKVAAAVKEAEQLVNHWCGQVKLAQQSMVGMANDLKTIQNRIKVGK